MKYPDITLGRVEAVWNKLGGEEGVQRFLAGHCEVVTREHVIDCDANPFVPDGWKVEEHRKGGIIRWDAPQVALYLSKGQQGRKVIEGNKLRTELADKSVFNANVLDYLLANPNLIPEEWKGKYVFFWGTVYRDSVGFLCVRYLGWGGHGWDWYDGWLGLGWDDVNPAAVPAS